MTFVCLVLAYLFQILCNNRVLLYYQTCLWFPENFVVQIFSPPRADDSAELKRWPVHGLRSQASTACPPHMGSTTTSQKPPFFDFPSTSSKPDQVPRNTNRRNSLILSMWSPSAWVARDHPLPPSTPSPYCIAFLPVLEAS